MFGHLWALYWVVTEKKQQPKVSLAIIIHWNYVSKKLGPENTKTENLGLKTGVFLVPQIVKTVNTKTENNENKFAF